MKNLKFLVIILSLGFITACHQQKKSSQTKENKPLSEVESQQDVIPNEYTYFQEQNLIGIKDADGEIIVPAQYDNIHFEKDLIIAQKKDLFYFFDGKKQIFEDGTDIYSIEDNYITCYNNHTGLSMVYFFKTGIALEKMPSCAFYEDAVMCQMSDNSYAFYTLDGKLKADNLKKIICLQKLSREGWVKEELFTFSKDGCTEKFIYDHNGNLKHEITLQIWQTFGTTYLTRVTGDDMVYEYTYSYRINLDRFIHDEKIGRTLNHYPEED